MSDPTDTVQVESVGESAADTPQAPSVGATSEPAETTTPEDDQGPQDQTDDDGRPKRDRYSERISALVAQRRAAEEAAATREAEVAELRAQLDRAQRGEPEPYDPTRPPDPAEYVHGDNDAEYMRHLGEHAAYQRFEALQSDAAFEAERAVAVEAGQSLVSAMAVATGYESGARYLQLAMTGNADVPFSAVLRETVQHQPEVAAEILSYLAETEGAIEEFHGLSSYEQAVRVGKVAAYISSQAGASAPTSQQPERRVSNAPAPPPRVGGRSQAGNPYEGDGEYVSVAALNDYAGRRS